jgi:hypothetical protein
LQIKLNLTGKIEYNVEWRQSFAGWGFLGGERLGYFPIRLFFSDFFVDRLLEPGLVLI